MARSIPRNSNLLLSHISADDYSLLRPHLEDIALPALQYLETPREPIDHVYFPTKGFASVLVGRTLRDQVEVGMIGREGMTGLPVVLGVGRASHETIVQNSGDALRIKTRRLKKLLNKSRSLHQCFLQYAHAFTIQAFATAEANSRKKVEERVARWILMAHDRIDSDDVAVTHDMLALRLGVRRPGVTVALNSLEEAELVAMRRGIISIVDRRGLERAANGSYGAAEAEFARLFGFPRRRHR